MKSTLLYDYDMNLNFASKSARTMLSSLEGEKKSNELNKATHDECEIFYVGNKTGNCETFFVVLASIFDGFSCSRSLVSSP
jgi:hypothetical protein